MDTKITDKNLATNIFDRDAIVYKMHGDISTPDEVILAKMVTLVEGELKYLKKL